jgi:type IV fimbrial biogenesis protein FimT
MPLFAIRKNSGFTIIELMVVLVVAGVLIGLAAPSFRSMMANNKIAAFSEDLVSAINFARVEAVKRSSPVSLCRTTDGVNCAGAGDWNTGFLVYLDSTASETATTTAIASNGLLRVYPPVGQQGVINVQRNGSAISFVRFTGLGTLAKNVNADVTFNVSFENCKGNQKRVTTLKLSGASSTTRQNCN